MKKMNKKNKQWLQSPDQMKTPKLYSVSMMRNKNGSFSLVDGVCRVQIRRNQHSQTWEMVDSKDFASVLRSSEIL